MYVQQHQYQEEEEQQQQQVFVQQEENSPTTDNQSKEETSGKPVSNAREGETVSLHESDRHQREQTLKEEKTGFQDDSCAAVETFLSLEPDVEKQTSSEQENIPTSSQIDLFREPEKMVDLDVSVESSPEVSEGLSIDPLTGLPEGWHRTKHERPKGSPYFHLKPAGSKILRSQIEVNSYLQQQRIKMKISLSGPVTRESPIRSPKKKINLKKRLPLLPSSSEELEERGEEPALEDNKSEPELPKSSVERGTDDEERELQALIEERNNIYQIPTSERTAAQNTRIYTLLKKIKKLAKKFPDMKVNKRAPFKSGDEKKSDTKNKERPLVPSKVTEQADNESTLKKSGQEQDADMSKETKRKKKKKKVPITPSEVVEDDEAKIKGTV